MGGGDIRATLPDKSDIEFIQHDFRDLIIANVQFSIDDDVIKFSTPIYSDKTQLSG